MHNLLTLQVRSMEAALASPSIPPEIVTTLLNLAEFMEHDDKTLPLDARCALTPTAAIGAKRQPVASPVCRMPCHRATIAHDVWTFNCDVLTQVCRWQ